MSETPINKSETPRYEAICLGLDGEDDSEKARDYVLSQYKLLERELTASQQTLAQKDAQIRQLREIVGMQSPLPLHDLLEHMANGLDHMFNEHQCDTDGWETWNEARKIARKTRAEIIKALSTPAPEPVVPCDKCNGAGYLQQNIEYLSNPICEYCMGKGEVPQPAEKKGEV